jgi:broad-specificity NMP kinase
VIVWINGTFGVGKTQTAHELRRRIGHGWIADPELVGYGLHRMQPRGMRGDFQDQPAWRIGVRDVLRRLDTERSVQPVITPMTLVVDAYADEILGSLRADGHDVRHVALMASPDTVRRRLRSRGSAVRDLWAEKQIERCTTALAAPRFAHHVQTDDRSIDEVVEDVAHTLGLPLRRPRDRREVAWLRRRLVQLRHVRPL